MDNSEGSGGGAQVVYCSHGGGPLPLLGEPGHRAMADFMRQLPSRLRRPDAIVVVSAHWEEPVATLTGAANPPMLYDYYGFPEESYRITYPAPGDPTLAQRIADELGAHRQSSRIDGERGFDHGLFVPLKLMYPQADIPAIQVSLLASLDATAHVALGKALRNLMGENILVIGSGASFHNVQGFSMTRTGEADPRNDAFQDWLIDVCTVAITPEEREQRLIDWEQAPYARYCHPREEHLLPLHVCAAMAQRPATVVFDDDIIDKRAVAFLWQ